MACVIALSSVAAAHIIPPEKLHPVAEAYRRAVFVLNLNPVRWEQVGADAERMASYWRALDSKAAGDFLEQVNRTIAAATAESEQRKDAARRVFETMTRAVATIGRAQLEVARRQVGDRDAAKRGLREAQGVYVAFDDALRATDRDGFRALGAAWLEMSSALGSAGLLGRGAQAVNRSRFTAAADRISAYMDVNFGAKFSVVPARDFAPLPTSSPTFDPAGELPVKLPPGHNINKQIPRPRQILNMAVRGVNESETVLIALGDMAFDSAYIFGEPARSLGISCNTCHNKGVTNPNFRIPGLSTRGGGMDVSNSFFAPHANNGHFGALDIPDLRGIRFTHPYGRNGRFPSLREFVRNVIVGEFNGPEPDPLLLDAMIAYMNEFDFLPNAALAKDGSLNRCASAAAKRGETVFNRRFTGMGNRSCATCHIPSANFLDHLQHDIGSVRGASANSLDRALDTPTLLGAKHTAPYFHDGSRPTLRAVNEWFNDTYQLGLSESELADLTAYVETVGDGIDAYEDTIYYLDAELEEFSFFLSAYEFLESRGKWALINTTFRTVALEILNHKWELRDASRLPVMDRLARIMEAAHAANVAGDRDKVRRLLGEYRELYARNADVLK